MQDIENKIKVAQSLTLWAEADVLEGIRIYLTGGLNLEMENRRWHPVTERPDNVEYIQIGNEYWIRNEGYVHPMMKPQMTDKVCQVCGSPMELYRVPSCTKMNPKMWRSRYECSAQWCNYEEYSVRGYDEELKEHGQ